MISTRELYLGRGQNFRIQQVSAEYITLEPTASISFQRCTIKTNEGDISFSTQTITNTSEETMQLSIIDGNLQLTPLDAAAFLETVGDDTDFTADTM